MTISLKANAAGTQGEIQLNGNPVAEFTADTVNFPGLAQSLAQNGYAKLPGGLIIQWGAINVPVTTGPAAGGAYFGSVTINLAIPFSNTGYVVQITLQDGPFAGYAPGWQNKTNGTFDALVKASESVPNVNFNWIAIGY